MIFYSVNSIPYSSITIKIVEIINPPSSNVYYPTIINY